MVAVLKLHRVSKIAERAPDRTLLCIGGVSVSTIDLFSFSCMFFFFFKLFIYNFLK